MPETGFTDGDVVTAADLNQIEDQQVTTCTSSTRPTGVEGRMIFETDTDKVMIYDGSNWRTVAGSDWAAFTPSWTNITLGNGSTEGEYRYLPGTMAVRATVAFGSTTTVDGDVTMTLPDSASMGTDPAIERNWSPLGQAVCRENGGGTYLGFLLYSLSTSFAVKALDASGTYLASANLSSSVPFTWGTGDRLQVAAIVPTR